MKPDTTIDHTNLLISSPKPTRKITHTTLVHHPSQSQSQPPPPPSPSSSLTQITPIEHHHWPPAPYGHQNLPRLTSSYHHSIHHDPYRPPTSDSNPIDPFTPPHHNIPSESSIQPSSSAHDHQSQPALIIHHLPRNHSQPHLPSIPPSLTLSLFTHLNHPNLSWTTKLKSLTATLAINLFLPFMNGIMLAFGEIAARELLGSYLGWGPAAYRYNNNPNRSLTRSPSKSDSTASQHPSSSFLKPSTYT